MLSDGCSTLSTLYDSLCHQYMRVGDKTFKKHYSYEGNELDI